MFRHLIAAWAILTLATIASAAEPRRGKAPKENPRLSGGLATTAVVDEQAYRQPVEWLNRNQQNQFELGEALFDDLADLLAKKYAKTPPGRDRNVVRTPAQTQRRLRGRPPVATAAPNADDLHPPIGPLASAHNCQNCHVRNGRGSLAIGYYATDSANIPIHLSVPGTGPEGGPLPHPMYGLQIQTMAVGVGRPEVQRMRSIPREIPGEYGDGEKYKLTRPEWSLLGPQYGAVGDQTLMSHRFTPSVFGLGLLEAVPDETILKMAEVNDADGNEVSGKANVVHDYVTGRKGVGRFGGKAQHPSVRQQIAASARFDHGVSTRVFPEDDMTQQQRRSLGWFEQEPDELSDDELASIELYMRSIAVPVRREHNDPQVKLGERVFELVGCANCHVPKLVTGPHELEFLANQTIYPYTDLLLHDMGPELADDRPVFEADGNEWRTPPLWGIGLAEKVAGGRTQYLHDGRAATLEEAILWHGGEAEKSREEFRKLPKADRELLLRFLASL